ncbi:MAG: hypothetical protein ACYTE3_31055 [Planctomycetota bacterium]
MKFKREITAGAESKLRALEELRSRFGTAKTLQHAAFRLVNRFFHFDCLHVMVLNRENLKPFDPARTSRLSTKIATLEELKEMERQGCWGLPEKAVEYFDRGDTCLLSYVDNNLAGYTWALKSGSPTLVPGLTLSVPREYLYNFCDFTHPDFRGRGLQSFRHHALLNHHLWRDKKGLLDYLVHTNHSSRIGHYKSGYRRLAKIYILGVGSRVYARLGKSLQGMGIKRINTVKLDLLHRMRIQSTTGEHGRL